MPKDKPINESVTIVVIDSGIDDKNPYLKGSVKSHYEYDIEDNAIVRKKHKKINHWHGTAIALIIKHLSKNTEFIDMCILDESLSSDGNILIKALEDAIDINPSIIHMSLGTTKWRYKHKIKKLIERADKKGIIVVAAANNNGCKSYPSHLKDVVGVKGMKLENMNQLYYDYKFIFAPYDLKGIEGIDTKKMDQEMVGNSMAAAYVTGHLSNIKYSLGYKDKFDILDKLRSNSILMNGRKRRGYE